MPLIKSLEVKSCADGSMKVEIEYVDSEPVGLFTRLGVASDMQEFLTAAIPALNWLYDAGEDADDSDSRGQR